MMPSSANSDARTAIFASIRENLAASAPFDKVRKSELDLAVPTSRPPASADLRGTFAQSLEMVGANCVVVDSENEGAEQLGNIVRGLAGKKVVVSDSDLVHRLAETAGIDAIKTASRDELFSADIGITSAQWVIAETGTLVLESGAESHRLVSLVPPVHVCVLKSGSIRQTMAEILELANTDTNPTITFITGASRTSDIELTLAIGVHGPRELHVIVIKD